MGSSGWHNSAWKPAAVLAETWQTHATAAATCLCRRANMLLQNCSLCIIYLQKIQLLGEDGAVVNISAGPFRSCSGGSVFVIDGPIT